MKKIISIASVLILFSCNNKSKNINETKIEEVQKDSIKTIEISTKPILKGDYCFQETFNKDTTTVRIRILSDDDIRGEMIWSPWQKDGAIGTLTGKINQANELELVYNYMIEGNRQTETKIMKIENDKIIIKRGELLDPKNDGNLIFKDVSKAIFKDTLNKINCN